MMVNRVTAAKYLDMIVDAGLLEKVKMGRSNYYINSALMGLFMAQNYHPDTKTDIVESVSGLVQ